MAQALKKFWSKQDTLERRLFWSILVVMTIVAICSAVYTIAVASHIVTLLCSVCCIVLCVLVGVVAVRTSLYNQCYLVLCSKLSCFLMPLLFLYCGGLTGCLILYCVTSLALLSLSVQGFRVKFAAFLVALAVQVAVVFVAWKHPEMLSMVLDRDDSYLDYLVAMILTASMLFVGGSLVVRSLLQEREKNIKLKARLDYLAMHDSLTGLYNRRYLLEYLESVVWKHRNDYYLAMFDMDNFKQINCNYGHDFGDEVICKVGKLLQKNEDELAGECVSRYGCEKFIYVISAGSEVEAYSKVEAFRKAVRQIPFDRFSQVQVTVSGGLLPCNARGVQDVRHLLSKVDELISVAKSQGKNQIRNMVND